LDAPPRGKEFWNFQQFGREMLPRFPMKILFVGLFTALLLIGASFAAINFGHREQPLPEETAASVVEKFYEYISEAKIRGGSLLINEAYKLTSGAQSQVDRALFLGIINRYPPGFRIEIVDSWIRDRHATVVIEYQMPSSFGDSYSERTDVHLNLDEETNTWKVDFRGDSDDQDRETIANTMQSETADTTPERSNGKGESR
jgi:hypothetical protein